jgi:hypothetical protein
MPKKKIPAKRPTFLVKARRIELLCYSRCKLDNHPLQFQPPQTLCTESHFALSFRDLESRSIFALSFQLSITPSRRLDGKPYLRDTNERTRTSDQARVRGPALPLSYVCYTPISTRRRLIFGLLKLLEIRSKIHVNLKIGLGEVIRTPDLFCPREVV